MKSKKLCPNLSHGLFDLYPSGMIAPGRPFDKLRAGGSKLPFYAATGCLRHLTTPGLSGDAPVASFRWACSCQGRDREFNHIVPMLPEIANRLQEQTDIHFLVIGEGAGKKTLELKCTRLGLKNITFLPLQNEATLPFSLSTGDIGIVALAKRGQGISMPSKTYYIMAAGSALMGFSGPDSDIAAIVRNYACGVNVEHGDVNGAVRAILELRDKPALLRYYRENARKAAEQHFSRDVCVPKILDLICDLL